MLVSMERSRRDIVYSIGVVYVIGVVTNRLERVVCSMLRDYDLDNITTTAIVSPRFDRGYNRSRAILALARVSRLLNIGRLALRSFRNFLCLAFFISRKLYLIRR